MPFEIVFGFLVFWLLLAIFQDEIHHVVQAISRRLAKAIDPTQNPGGQ